MGHTIGYAIESVLAQTHRYFRLHVVGDGCDAASARVVAGFSDPRVTFLQFPKAYGVGYANRQNVAERSRSWGGRWNQVIDFMRSAMRGGLKVIRFWYERRMNLSGLPRGSATGFR